MFVFVLVYRYSFHLHIHKVLIFVFRVFELMKIRTLDMSLIIRKIVENAEFVND